MTTDQAAGSGGAMTDPTTDAAREAKMANGIKAIRELARQVAFFYPEASERIKEAAICIVDEAEHVALLARADGAK